MCNFRGQLMLRCFLAVQLVRWAAESAYRRHGRSTLAGDLIPQLQESFMILFTGTWREE